MAIRRRPRTCAPPSPANHAGRMLILRRSGVAGNVVLYLAFEPMVCDCGEPASHVGIFRCSTIDDFHPIKNHSNANAMWLCSTCAGQVDAGVTVLPLVNPFALALA
jgi:hypothetical protein